MPRSALLVVRNFAVPHRALYGLQVLVAEDAYLIAADLATAVRHAGGAVIGPVGSLDEALAALTQTRPDMAILDINLRGSVAYPMADALERLAIPFVFATGYSADTVPAGWGHIRRCEKPYSAADVVSALGRTRDNAPLHGA